VISFNPAIVFFRWDLNGDTVWDVPDQTGGGPLGRWTTDPTVTVAPGAAWYDPDAATACVQGWDGASTVVVGGVVEPDGPVVCSTPYLNARLLVRPGHWSNASQGHWVRAFLHLPRTANATALDVSTVALEGVAPVSAEEGTNHPSEGAGGATWIFRFDRQALTAAWGPGRHEVHLTAAWEGGTLTATDVVTIE